MRKHVIVLLLFMLLALALTWPLALNFTTHVVGDGSDDPALTWNLWWFKHALLDLQVSPLTTDYMFYPIGINLVFYTLTLLNDALAMPLYALLGLVPAANVSLLSSFVLCGYGAFLLAMYTGKRVNESSNRIALFLGAVLAGIVYAFSSNKLLYASLGQFNIASTQWIPFYALYLFRLRDTWDGRDRGAATRNMLLAALFLLLQAYSEFTFASFLVIFTAFFALWQLRPLWLGIRRLGWLAALGAVFALGFLPVLVPMIAELRTEGDILVEGSGFADAFSADLLGFLVPSKLNPWLGSLDSHFAFPYINFVFTGWLTLVLALAGAWLFRRAPVARFWSASTLAFAVIALGPGLRIDGNEIIGPLPFVILQWLPFFKGNRYPSRFSVMITLGVAILVALAVQHILTRLATRQANRPAPESPLFPSFPFISPNFLFASFLGALILTEHLSVLPLSDYTVPSFYQEIRADPGDFTVMELPMAWRNGFRVTGALEDSAGKAFMLAQYFQTVHEHPMLSGNTSRNPELKFQYFTESPVINSLIALETGHDLDAATLASDKTLAPTVFAFFNVRYIVVRPEAGPTVEPYLKAVLPGLTLWRQADNIRVYRLDEPPPPQVLTIDPKSPLARLYFGEGWGELGETRAWAQREETRLTFPMASGRSYALNMTVIESANNQQLSVRVNDRIVESLPIKQGSAKYNIVIDQRYTHPGVNDLALLWANQYSLVTLNQLKDINLGALIVAKSAGQEVGDFAHLWLGGVDYSPNQRGYNVGFFTPSAEGGKSFDTFQAASESDRLADVLMHGMPLRFALAVRDEATMNRTPRLVSALQSVGAQIKIGWRWSYAFIKYVGQPTDTPTIREDASPIRPAIVSIGERITAPQVAGAIESIELRAAP